MATVVIVILIIQIIVFTSNQDLSMYIKLLDHLKLCLDFLGNFSRL